MWSPRRRRTRRWRRRRRHQRIGPHQPEHAELQLQHLRHSKPVAGDVRHSARSQHAGTLAATAQTHSPDATLQQPHRYLPDGRRRCNAGHPTEVLARCWPPIVLRARGAPELMRRLRPPDAQPCAMHAAHHTVLLRLLAPWQHHEWIPHPRVPCDNVLGPVRMRPHVLCAPPQEDHWYNRAYQRTT